MNPFKRFHLNIIDPDFYKVYLKESFFKALLFAAFITIIASLPQIASQSITYHRDLTRVISVLQSDTFPGYVFENGQLNSKTGAAFEHTEGNTLFIFDPIGAYSLADMVPYETGFLFTADALIIHTRNAQSIRMPYENNLFLQPLLRMDMHQFISLMDATKWLSITLLGVIYFMVHLLFTGVAILFLSLSANLNNSIFKTDLPFKACAKIATYGILLPMAVYRLFMTLPMGNTSFLLLLVFYFASGRFISRTFRAISSQSN